MCAREGRGDGCECIRRVRRWDARTRGAVCGKSDDRARARGVWARVRADLYVFSTLLFE